MSEWFRWAVEIALLLYICNSERKAVHISREVLKFYSDFIASRTKWYAARTGKKSVQKTDKEPPLAEGSTEEAALAQAITVAEADQINDQTNDSSS